MWWTCIAMVYCNFVSGVMRLGVHIAVVLYIENVNNAVYHLSIYGQHCQEIYVTIFHIGINQYLSKHT